MPRAALAAAALVVVAGVAGTGATVRASVPATPPTFTSPLVFTNSYFPFVPAAVKVFRGKSEGARTTVVDIFREDTRDFILDSTTVTCRLLQETEFEDGELVEISYNYFAQADDGTVYYFGEVVDNYEDGEVVDHGGSWLVGGPVGDDPPETATVSVPALFMPANPEVGDEFRPEDVPGGPQEIDTVHAVDRNVKVPAGENAGCVEIRELSLPDQRETKWYAPGVGVIKAKGKGEILKLDASTLRAAE
jgi:hypothetical protein